MRRAGPEGGFPAPRIDPDTADRARLSEEMALVLKALGGEGQGFADPTRLPPGAGRALVERANRRWRVGMPATEVRRARIPADEACGSRDRAARVFLPQRPAAGAILYIHGGGWAFGSVATHEPVMRRLAVEAGLPVVGIDYRLAPEDPFPGGLKDCVAAWRSVASKPDAFGLRPGPAFVAGDSAGANLALALMLHEQQAGRRLPDGAFLCYGVYDADFGKPSYRRFRQGFPLTAERMRNYWDWYLPDPARREDPLASPLKATDAALGGLPPMLLAAAGLDCLLDDTLALAARLRALGRRDPCRVYPGVVHGFLQMSAVLETGRQALREIGSECRRLAPSP